MKSWEREMEAWTANRSDPETMSPARAKEFARIAAIRAAFPGEENHLFRLWAIMKGIDVEQARLSA